MSNIANETPEILKSSLINALRIRAEDDGLDFGDVIPSDLFANLIRALHKKYKQSVVVLIDEYDKPILDHLTDVEAAKANRSVIRSFYGILKSMDPYLRLTFLTGVSKFTKTSIFSELNNLTDITMLGDYANICGIPVEELDLHFREHIEALAPLAHFRQYENIRDEILAWYDGYSWDGESRVINPFGLLSFFRQKRFSSFWYASGSPKFLLDMIREKPEIYTSIHHLNMGEWELDNFDVEDVQAAPLLFQTGYLTVVEALHGMGSASYRMDIPNLEVREAFNLHLLAVMTGQGGSFAGSAYRNMMEALRAGDLGRMLGIMKSFFASIPYEIHVSQEAYYHSLFYAMASLLGFKVDAEVSVSGGRIDAVLELADKVYILEFKYEHCPPDADEKARRKLFDGALDKGVQQLLGKGYADKFRGSGKEIIQAAFAFLGRDEVEMRVIEERP